MSLQIFTIQGLFSCCSIGSSEMIGICQICPFVYTTCNLEHSSTTVKLGVGGKWPHCKYGQLLSLNYCRFFSFLVIGFFFLMLWGTNTTTYLSLILQKLQRQERNKWRKILFIPLMQLMLMHSFKWIGWLKKKQFQAKTDLFKHSIQLNFFIFNVQHCSLQLLFMYSHLSCIPQLSSPILQRIYKGCSWTLVSLVQPSIMLLCFGP